MNATQPNEQMSGSTSHGNGIKLRQYLGSMLNVTRANPNQLKTILRENMQIYSVTKTTNVVPTPHNCSTESNVLIYNRVPKCGSTTMMEVMALQAKLSQNTTHPFKHIHSDIFTRVIIVPFHFFD